MKARLPPEIASPPPRDISTRGAWASSALLLVLFAFFFGASVFVFERGYVERTIGERAPVPGFVSLAKPSTKHAGEWLVQYRYDTGLGLDRAESPAEDPKTGTPVDVRSAKTLFGQTVVVSSLGLSHLRKEGGQSMLLGGWMAVLAAVAAALALRGLFLRRWLLRNGVATIATVTEVRRGVGRRQGSVVARVERGAERTELTLDVLRAQVAQHGMPQVGAPIAVLYAPDRPKRALAYAWGAAIERG